MKNLKKYKALFLSLLACILFLTSCVQMRDIFSPDDGVPPGVRPEKPTQAEKYNTAYISALVEAQTSKSVLGLFADDFDFDGVYEAYVLTSTRLVPEGAYHSGGISLWFVKNDKLTELIPESDLAITPEIWNLGDKKLFSIDVYSGNAASTAVFFVSGNSAYSYGDFGAKLSRASADSRNFYLFENTDRGRGKIYYLYFDGNFFCEYGGLGIRADQLRALSGADEILSAVSDGGYIIGDIFYRDNGIININLSKDMAGQGTAYENVTLMLSDKAVRLVPLGTSDNPLGNLENTDAAKHIIDGNFADAKAFSYGGTYKASILEGIAVYPEKLSE